MAAKRRRRRKRPNPQNILRRFCQNKPLIAGILALCLLLGIQLGRDPLQKLDFSSLGAVGDVLSDAVEELYGNGAARPKPLYGAPKRAGNELELHMIDVGQGLSVLVRAPDGTSALIDAGDRDDGAAVTDYLRRQGVEKINTLVATHAHADHIGGMADVVKNLPVDRFIMTPLPEKIQPTTKSYTDLLRALSEKGVKITPARAATRYILGSAQMTIEGPLEEYEELNNTSVACRIQYGDRAFLVTGDAEEQAESAMVRRGRKLSSDVLIAGHHGSHTSSSQKFLNAVRPLYVGISCGEGNSYGHPHQEILKRFEKMKCAVLRTDIQGNVVFYTDGESIHVAVDHPDA